MNIIPKLLNILCLFCLWGMTLECIAQTDSTINATTDSLLNIQQERTKDLLAEADSAHFADSLQQIQLVNEIEKLRESDKLKKAALQARLDSLKYAQEKRDFEIKNQVDSMRGRNPGVPVDLFGDTVFFIYAKLGPFSPTDRANSIKNKIEKLVDEGTFEKEKLTVFKGEESDDIMVEGIIILSITDRDAFWMNEKRDEAAELVKERILKAVSDYQERTGIWKSLMRFSLLLLISFILGLIIKYLNRAVNWFYAKLMQRGKRIFTGLKIKNYEFLSPEREEQVIKGVLNIFKWVLILMVIYIALPIMFSIFPQTKGIALKLIGYVVDPLKAFFVAIINYIPELITIIVIVVLTRYFVRAIKYLSNEIRTGKLEIPGFYPDWAVPTYNLLKIIIYAFSFIVIFPYLPGSDSPVFRGVSVFLGVLFSLGSSSAISNLVAGLVITYMRSFSKGDRVKIGENVGDVIEKNMLVTRIRTIKNEEITIPNSSILSGSTVNYTDSAEETGLILNTAITIGYDASWRQVHELLIEAALKTEHVLSDPKPFVFQTSLDDYYVSYQINAYTKQADKAAKIYSDLHANIQDGFNEAGIEIMSPHYRAARDGNAAAVPVNYLPPNYIPPVFKVDVNPKNK